MEAMEEENEVSFVQSLASKVDVTEELLSKFMKRSKEIGPFLKKVNGYIRERETHEDLVKQEVTTLRRQRLNAEHQVGQLEKQLISCNTKLDKATKELEMMAKNLSDSEKDASDKQSSLTSLKKENENMKTQLEQLTEQKQQLTEEKNEVLELVERRNIEVDRLNDEWKAMSEKAAASNDAKLKAQEKLDEIQSQEITREFKTKRLEQEKQLLSQQVDQLNEDVKLKTNEIAGLKKSKSTELIEIRSKLEEKDQEVTHLTAAAEAAKKSCAEQAKRIESLMERLKNTRENASETENHLQQELLAKGRLVTLYKDSAEDKEKKVANMTVALEEMQKLCKEAMEAKTKIEADSAASCNEHQRFKTESENRIQTLESELRNANDLLEASRKRGTVVSGSDVEEMSPSAAATSAMLKRGMTLTQIYSEFVKVSDALEDEKIENERLKQYMEQILQEIEEKSPLLKQQKDDYEHALVTIDNLTTKLDATIKELHDQRGECADQVKRAEYLKRENCRLSDLTGDLGRQVRYLLKECEEARGGVVSTEQERISELANENVTSSSQVISENLVTFKNIEELQSQNQKLLAVVRELAEENEKAEKEQTKEKFEDLQSKLDAAIEQLEQMKEERKTQEDLMQNLVRQRDTYKVLYASSPKEQIESSVAQERIIQSPLKRRTSLSLETELNKSKLAYENVSEQFEDFKKDSSKKERRLTDENDKLSNELSSLKLENQKLKSELEFSEERHSLLQTSIDGYKKESTAVHEKCRSITIALGKAQTESEHYKQELETSREKMISAEVARKTLEAEKKMIKDAEKRLLEENKSLLEQQRSQNSLLTNLQTIQNSLERQEFETRSKLSSQVENLQQELKVLRRKLDSGERDSRIVTTANEKKIEALNNQLKAEIKEKEDANTAIVKARGEILSLTQKLSEAENQLKASEARLKTVLERETTEGTEVKMKKIEDSLNDRIKELENKLSEAEKQRQVSSGQLTQARKHLIQYKEIAAANESALQDVKKTNDQLKEESEKKLASSEKQIKDLQSKFASATAAQKAAETKMATLLKESSCQKDEQEKEIKSLQFQLEQTKEALKTASAQEKTAKDDFANQLKIAKETQDKYERELMLHAKDVEALVHSKEQIQQYDTTKDALEVSLKEAQEKLNASENVLTELKKHQEEESAKLNARVKDLVDQNSILHSQVEKLSAELTSAKARPISFELPESEGGEKSTEELYEVIRFIRREKEIAETKNEVAQSESIRYRQRAEFLEKELEDTKGALATEQKRTQGHMMTPEEHKEISEKVEKVKQLTELNKELERQKGNVERGNNLLRGKLRQMENEITSLKDSKKQVEEEKDALFAEKTALKSEVQRWTARTNQLIEQNAKVDTKEVENLQRVKAHNEKVIAALKQDNQRSKDQIEHLNKELTKIRHELQEQQLKAKQLQGAMDSTKSDKDGVIDKLNKEMEEIKKQLDEKAAEIAEKTKLNNQLRKLAKKYKMQSDDLQKGKAEGTGTAAATVGGVEQSDTLETTQDMQKELHQKLEQAEQKLREQEHKVTENDSKMQQMEQKTKELEQKLAESEQKFRESEDKAKQIEDSATAQRQKFSELETSVGSLNKQLEEYQQDDEKKKVALKEKEERNKKVLIALRTKITNLTTQKDKITNENEELKKTVKEAQDTNDSLEKDLHEKDVKLNSFISQHEAQIARLEQELKNAKDAHMKTQDEYEKLQQENRNIHKAFSDAKEAARAAQVLEAQKQVRAYASSTQTAKVRAQAASKPVHQDSLCTEGSPLTATVRPTSSSSTNQTPNLKVMTMPTASIRPIPFAPTPTAMVSPTVPLTQADAPMTSTMSVAVTATVTATQRQADSAASQSLAQTSHRRSSDGEPVVPGPRHGSASFKAPVTRATAQVAARDSQGMDIQTDRIDISGSGTQTTEIEEYDNSRPESHFREHVQPQMSSSEAESSQSSRERPELGGARGLQHPVGKRTRLADDYPDREEPGTSGDISEQPELKRVRTQEIIEPQVSSVSSSASSEVAGASIHAVSVFEQESEPSDDVMWGPKEESSQDYRDDAIEQIVSLSEGPVQDEDSVSVETARPSDQEPGHADISVVTGTSAEPESSIEYASGDPRQGDVLQDQVEMPQRGREAVTVSEGLRAQPIRRQPSPFGLDPAGRGRFIRARYQLPSFSLPPGQGGSGGPFDDADDCTVPSTPTLYIPKRTDGFAEAVSSPQVRYPVFSFGSSTDPSQGSTQQSALEVGDDGLRLDETRVDLMAGDEPASVPNTPLGVVPSGTVFSSARIPVMAPGRINALSQPGLEENGQEQNVPQQIDLTGDDDEDDDVAGMEDVGEEEEDDDGTEEEIILVEEGRDFSDMSETSETSEQMDRDPDNDNDKSDDDDNLNEGQGSDQDDQEVKVTGVSVAEERRSTLGAASGRQIDEQAEERASTSGASLELERRARVPGQRGMQTLQRGRGATQRPRLRRTHLSGRGRFKSIPQKYTPSKEGRKDTDEN